MPSFYQDQLYRALVRTGHVDLRVVYAREIGEERKRLGWRSMASGYEFRRLSHPRAVLEACRIARTETSRLHIVNGIWAEPAFTSALLTLGRRGASFIIYAEAPDPRVPRGLGKRAIRRALGGWVVRRAAGVLAISRFSEEFHRGLGFREEAIYPFGYFRESPSFSLPPERNGSHGTCEFVFIGQLVQRKGVDLLVEALRPLAAEFPGVHLSLIGEGADRPELESQVRQAGLERHVSFEGALPYDRVLERLMSADLLVLPSRWDGWGLVVNEAFAMGVPVIASDLCGASDLIRNGSNGFVFRSGDAADLRRRLSEFLSLGEGRRSLRSEALRTGKAVAVESAADYLVACLTSIRDRSEKPVPPWGLPEPGGPTQ